MPTNILIPLDGSPVGEAALPYAETLAERTGATVTLVRAARALPARGTLRERQARAVEDAETYLSAIAAGLRDRGLNVETGVSCRSPAAWIVEQIEPRKVDLVVMATHDRAGASRWVRGSIAESVVRHARIPVLLIRVTPSQRTAERFGALRPTVVVPLDGSELAEAALPVASDLTAALGGGTLVLVGVVSCTGQPGADVGYTNKDFGRAQEKERALEAQELQEQARAYLAATASRLSSQFEISIVVRHGEPASEIICEAEERGAAALVMATHGRTGVLRTLLGSVAGQVVHSSSTPVLLVHPNKLRSVRGHQPQRMGWGAQVSK